MNRLREDQAMCVNAMTYWADDDRVMSFKNYERQHKAWKDTAGLPAVPADVDRDSGCHDSECFQVHGL